MSLNRATDHNLDTVLAVTAEKNLRRSQKQIKNHFKIMVVRLKHVMIYQLLITVMMLTSLEGQTKSMNSSTESPTTSGNKTSCNESNICSTLPNVCYFDLCHTVNAFFLRSITVFCETKDIYLLTCTLYMVITRLVI